MRLAWDTSIFSTRDGRWRPPSVFDMQRIEGSAALAKPDHLFM